MSVTRLRETRDRLFATGSVTDQETGEPRELFPVAIGLQEGQALRDWVHATDALRTLETGLGFGIAALSICEGLLMSSAGRPGAEGRHLAIDPHQTSQAGFGGAGLRVLDEAGVREMVEFEPEPSEIVLPRLLAEGRRFDLAFVDGNHRFEGVFLDLVYAGRLLEDRSTVFVDDVQLPAVARAVSFCTMNLGWTIEGRGSEGPAHSWAVLQTGSSDAYVRPFTQFVDF
jgi:hypothetical protein